jgi:hypothetical protein
MGVISRLSPSSPPFLVPFLKKEKAKKGCVFFLFMLRFPLMENKGVLHVNFSGTAKRKTINNKIIGGNHEI